MEKRPQFINKCLVQLQSEKDKKLRRPTLVLQSIIVSNVGLCIFLPLLKQERYCSHFLDFESIIRQEKMELKLDKLIQKRGIQLSTLYNDEIIFK